MPDVRPVPYSVEVLEHHAQRHARRCPDARLLSVPCPCGSSAAIICSECRDPIFLACNPDAEICEHARPFLPGVFS